MRWYMAITATLVLLFGVAILSGCEAMSGAQADTPRQSLFIGVDVSGSFMNGEHFDDSIEFRTLADGQLQDSR